MRILALDTATEACSAAVLCAPAAGAMPGASPSLFSRYEEPGRGHAERILAMIDAVLREAQLPLHSLDAVAFGRGPGGFTGVRLAASIAQGLAFGAGLPVMPVSDLRAVAQRALDGSSDAQCVLVCADARMREVYWGCFRRNAQGMAEPFGGEPERVSAPEAVELPRLLEAAAASPGATIGAGRGFDAYPQLRARLGARLAAIHGDPLPRAAEIARLGAADLAAGLAVAPHDAVPIYLRDDVARPPASR